MTSAEMKARTRRFALDVIQLAERLPRSRTGDVIGKQLIRCGTSVGANYRAACRGRSTAEFLAKLGIVEEEADEAIYWLELIHDGKLLPADVVAPVMQVARSLLAMIIASIKTTRRNAARSLERANAPR